MSTRTYNRVILVVNTSKILLLLFLLLEVTIASEVLPWVFKTKTKHNHLLIPLGLVV